MSMQVTWGYASILKERDVVPGDRDPELSTVRNDLEDVNVGALDSVAQNRINNSKQTGIGNLRRIGKSEPILNCEAR